MQEFDMSIYENEENLNRILSLKDKHKDQRVFIIGTGPSLNETNFDLIKNEILFGVNTLYKGIDKFRIQPQYYGCTDPVTWRLYGEDMLKLNTTLFIAGLVTVNDYMKKQDHYEAIQKQTPIWLKHLGAVWISKEISTDLTKGVYNGDTVIIDIPLQACFYLGFSEVYLLGCDCDYSLQKHFYAGEDKLKGEMHYDRVFPSYEVCKHVYESHNRKIINCGTNGKLSIFERVSLEEICKKK